jgi:hypothetical protein
LFEADVQRILVQLHVVGADIERDRQAIVGMQAGAGGVERELADRDAHAERAQVAEAEDALAVGHDDHAHVGVRPVRRISAMRPRSRMLMNMPRGRRKMAPYSRQAWPTVGV